MATWLFGNALVSVGLAVVAVLLGLMLRRRPALMHQLWVLVLVAPLLPPLPPLPSVPGLTSVRPAVDSLASVETSAPIGAPGLTLEATNLSAATPDERPLVAGEGAAPRPADARAWSWPSVSSVAPVGLAIGSLLALLVVLRRVVRSRRLLHGGVAPTPKLERAVARIASQLSVAPPRVRVVAGLGSPSVIALGAPVLLWPADADVEDSVIAHELAHVKRRDTWVGWVELLAVVAAWWNPVTWWARRRVHELAEECCDAWAVRVFPRRRRRYAEALVETVERMLERSPEPGVGLGVASRNRRSLERRLRMVMEGRTSPKGSLPFALALVACGAFAAPTWSDDGEEGSAAKQAVNQGVEAFKHKRWTEAVSAYKRAMKLDPECGETTYRLGYANLRAGDYVAARKAFERQLELGYNAQNAYRALGQIAQITGGASAETEFVAALGYVGGDDEGAAESPGALARLAALGYVAGGQTGGAPAKETLSDKQRAEALRIYGRELFSEGEDEAARRAFERAAKLDPDDPSGLFTRAKTAARNGDLEAAVGLLERAVKGGYYHHGKIEEADEFEPLTGSERYEAVVGRAIENAALKLMKSRKAASGFSR